MKRFSLYVLCLLSLVFLTLFAFDIQAGSSPNYGFEAIKIYNSRELSLHDALEFSVFDLSEVSIINDSLATQTIPTFNAVTAEGTAHEVEQKIIQLGSLKSTVTELPKTFFNQLKSAIWNKKLPITLYSGSSPKFTRPLALNIKVKKIHISPCLIDKKGICHQTITLRIFGEVKDKTTQETLFKYYDYTQEELINGKDLPNDIFAKMTKTLMERLVKYLKTLY